MKARLILATWFSTLLLFHNVPALMAECLWNGCNSRIRCTSVCWDDSGREFHMVQEERAVDGFRYNCNIFGCNCDNCDPDYEMAYYAQWCFDQYEDDTQVKIDQWCKKAVSIVKCEYKAKSLDNWETSTKMVRVKPKEDCERNWY